MTASHLGDDTKAAGMIAALGNLDVGECERESSGSARVIVGNVARTAAEMAKAGQPMIAGKNVAKHLCRPRPT